jgi:hypothetical protein
MKWEIVPDPVEAKNIVTPVAAREMLEFSARSGCYMTLGLNRIYHTCILLNKSYDFEKQRFI